MVSIIVPIYNTEKYVINCIKSILNQTYTDYEVLIVNDGTNDNAMLIVEDMVKNDKRFKLFNRENGGLSSARNYGIEKASGEWVTFLDSDDYISDDYLEKSIAIANKYKADIAIMRMCNISENTNNFFMDENECLEELCLDSERAIEESLYQKRFSCCAPGKIYRRDVIGNIRFPLGKLSEDLAVCHKFLDNSKRIAYLSRVGYYYRQHDNSIMHTFNIKRLDALEWSNEIEKFCEEKYPKIKKAAICRTFNIAIHFLIEIPIDDPIREKCIGIIKSNVYRTRMSVIFNPKARNRERFSALLSFFGKKMLKKVWNSKVALKQKEY